MSDIDFINKLSGVSAVGGEDGRAVAVRIRINQINGIVKRIGGQNDENRSEDLLLVALHVRLHVGDYGRSNEIALLEAFNNQIGAIQYDFGALARCVLYDVLYSLFGLRWDDRTDVGVLNVSSVHLQALGTLYDVWNPVSRFANQNCGRSDEIRSELSYDFKIYQNDTSQKAEIKSFQNLQGHATLTSRTERCTCDLRDGKFFVRIRQNDT